MGDIDALVGYFCREKLYRHAQAVVEEVAVKRGWEGKLLFWKCFGLGQEGNVNQAIRELEELRRKRDFEFAATEALLHFHKSVRNRDESSINELERNQSGLEERSSDASSLLAATFLLHIEEFTRAKRITDRILEKNPMNVKACTLRGWIDTLNSTDANRGSRRDLSSKPSALQDFDQALNADRTGKKELDALMGKAYFLMSQGKNADALETLDQAVVSYQWFLPALVEKARVLVLMQKWDLALETAERVLQQDANDIGSLQLVALYRITNDCVPEETLEALQQLSDVLDRYEPENPALWFRVSQPFARLAERNEEILRKTLRLIERAKRRNPENPEFATEYAYQLALMKKFDSAFAAYEQASQLDESNGNALFGQIYCLVKRNEIEEASQQLEFLSVLQETIGRTAQVAFLEAMLVWKRDKDRKTSLKLLNETVHLHVRAFQSKRSLSMYDHYVRFNPDFMMEIAQEYLQHAGTEPMESSEAPPQYLTNGIKLLEKTIKFVPCMLSAQIALARARFVSNNMEAATKAVQQVLDLDPNFVDAHLLQAQIQLAAEDFTGARNSLEQALSHDFAVKDSPTYMIVKGRVFLATGELDEAKTVLEQALKLPGVRTRDSGEIGLMSGRSSRGETGSSSSSLFAQAQSVSMNERVSIFIDLAAVYVALKQLDKAKQLIREARKEFKGTEDEVRVIVADSEIALKRNDVKGALRMLNEVPTDSPAFTKAHMVKAGIYLNHRNDRDAYIRCYMDLVEYNPSAHTHLLLGEAYMKVNMPDDAIEAFKEALKRNPKDSELAKKIGKVLVSTHDYNRAIEYYKSALRSADSGSGRQALRLDLSELYFNLGKLSKAEKELQSALSDFDTADDDEGKESEFSGAVSNKNASIPDLVGQVKALKLLAKVHEGEKEWEKVAEDLFQARTIQGKVLSALRSSASPEVQQQQKNEMAGICLLLAAHFENAQRDEEQAVSMYNEALRHDPGNVPSMLALATFYLRTGDLERCHNQCVTIMRVDEHNEQASMMLADLMFQRNEFKVSIYHYQEILERNPGNFVALAKLVGLLFRGGELDTAERYFQLAEHKMPRVIHDAGFCYCKGLFHRYSNEVTEAISQFNKARRDVTWGQKALTQMIEIYVNPDNANLWEDESTAVDGSGTNLEAVRTAQQLLEEFPDKSSITYRLLECYATMATKHRADVEKAFQRLVEIRQEKEDHVPSLLALSTALMMMKQTPKARNQLKKISQMQYDQEQADVFEKCWLLLADIFIGSGKYDLAQGLCKRCLQYNRSCAKAWEYMGMIMEKEAAYADAAEHYEQAWKFQKKSSASVGYKLAFNYLKAKRYVEAIDVANTVLQQFPQYPKIRKDVLEKARASIRA